MDALEITLNFTISLWVLLASQWFSIGRHILGCILLEYVYKSAAKL